MSEHNIMPTDIPDYEQRNEDLEFTKDLVCRAGVNIREALAGQFETRWKPDNTPVTDIDEAVNSMVNDELNARYPQDRVYGEEASVERADAEHTWVLDPIDGTQALGKLDTFTICLARLDHDGRPLFSVVYNPLRDRLFVAERGKRSLLNGQPISVSEKSTIKSSYIHFGSALRFDDLAKNGVAYDRLEGQGAKIFNTRSLAHGCVEVARGEFDAAFVGVKTPFEAASVALIVEGAGGRVTNLYGEEPGRFDGNIKGLIVSNGLIHGEVVNSLKLT